NIEAMPFSIRRVAKGSFLDIVVRVPAKVVDTAGGVEPLMRRIQTVFSYGDTVRMGSEGREQTAVIPARLVRNEAGATGSRRYPEVSFLVLRRDAKRFVLVWEYPLMDRFSVGSAMQVSFPRQELPIQVNWPTQLHLPETVVVKVAS